MTNSNYGGPLEYLMAALLVLQILMGRTYLRRWRAEWPHAAFVAVLAVLVLLWSTTLAAISLTLSGTMYTSRVIPVGLGAAVSAAGYFWMLLSSMAIAVALAARFLLSRGATKASGLYSPARRRWIGAVGLAAMGAPATAVAFGAFIERNRYGVLELDLPIPGLHPDLDGFRLVQVSDLHVSPFLSPREAGRVIDMANELRPDLAVFTGDLISELGDPLDQAIRELIRLRADLGVFGCMGNHEQYVVCRNYLERQARQAGLVFLRNTAVQVRRGQARLNIAGVDYQPNSQRANYLPGAERLVISGATNLLLSHNPDVFPTAIRRGFQAVLSGHTHGGQVNVEILHRNINPARFRTPFTSGLYRLGASEDPRATDAGGWRAFGEVPASCFVTNGIGTIGMPIRLGAPPEIALLRLRRA